MGKNATAADDSAGTERAGPSPTSALARGLAVLDVLTGAGQPMTLAEIANQVHLDHSTALRILRTLQDSRHVIRINEGRRYLPSPKALRPLPILHPLEQLRREAEPLIRDLATEIAKTVVLVAYLGLERLVVDIAQTAGSLSPYYSTWLDGPLHASGPGKALLLTMDQEQRRAVLGETPYPTFTPHTITSADELERDLSSAAERGYVVVRDEFYSGVTAVAANYVSWSERVAGCIVATGHSREFNKVTLPAVGEMLVRCAKLMPLQAASLQSFDQFCGR